MVLLSLFAGPAFAAAPTSAPQVLLAITNSESMDGDTTSGAIRAGSGALGASLSSLNTSSSTVNYTIPTGFTPPLNAGSGGSAPYTVTCNTYYQCDNGPSRLNMTKAAISSMLASYGTTLNFGLYVYSTGSPSLYNTWVYYMSPSGGFTFTNTSSGSTVANPCYAYTTASSSVSTACASIAAQYPAGTVASNPYMSVAASSDNPLINDVLYAGGGFPAAFITYGTVSPANPYTYYSLSTYNTNIGGYSEGYSQTAPNIGQWSTTPTNAGYVPFSPQVMYAQRGFGYGASQSATTGSAVVAMGTDPSTSSAFTNALAPETNNSSSSEIKSVAGQSGIYSLMNGALSYMQGLTKATCQSQYVVLLTDGLPTLDSAGNAWPPLGTTTGNAYSLSASYNADGSFASSNSQAVTDAITAIAALKKAGIQVYVIGLGAAVTATNNPAAAPLLQAMALAGGTSNFYPATNASSLTAAFSTIANQIYNNSSVAAPVAPISVANGSSDEYELTSVASPGAGHVRAYPVSAGGVAGTTQDWDAAANMSTTNRTSALMAANASNSIVTLANVDAAAFNLTPTTCVPNVATLISYTITPSYSGSGCSYLAGRDPNSLLGPFSTQNTGRYVGPPASSLLSQSFSSYVTYARGASTRQAMLLFSNEDGFIYAVSAQAGSNGGQLLWAWTSRNLLAQMQNYNSFQSMGYTNGNFAVVDAMDGSGAWASYLVGSLQSGAEHFSVKLDASGTPTSLIYDNLVSNGAVAGDKAGVTGTTPLRQPPVTAYIGNAAYQVYVVTVGGISTLYETNVATGASTSTPLSFRVTSMLSINSSTNQLYLGGSDGTVWVTILSSGTAATDIALIQKIGTTVNPANGNALANVLYVGYTEQSGVPYVYALNAAQLTLFGVTSAGWTPLWASTPSAGYAYASSTWSTSTVVSKMTAGSVVSDLPIVDGGALLVPAFVSGSACTAGLGYYDFFNLANGAFPNNLPLYANNVKVTADLQVGVGPAFTPSLTLISGGVAANPGSQGSTVPTNPLTTPGTPFAKAVSWRQH